MNIVLDPQFVLAASLIAAVFAALASVLALFMASRAQDRVTELANVPRGTPGPPGPMGLKGEPGLPCNPNDFVDMVSSVIYADAPELFEDPRGVAFKQALRDWVEFHYGLTPIQPVPRDANGIAQPDVPRGTLDAEELANRFLAWRLPDDFAPDCGISFTPLQNYYRPGQPIWPVGTNLFTYAQAKAMFEELLK